MTSLMKLINHEIVGGAMPRAVPKQAALANDFGRKEKHE